MVKPLGAYHLPRCSGRVHASNTRLRGASRMRVITTVSSSRFMRLSLQVDQGLEAAVDHAPRVEGHGLGIHGPGNALVGHHLLVDAVPVAARLVHDVGKEHRLTRLELHAAGNRGRLSW